MSPVVIDEGLKAVGKLYIVLQSEAYNGVCVNKLINFIPLQPNNKQPIRIIVWC